MKNTAKLGFIVAILILVASVSAAKADIVWDWSFDDEAGQFITNGSIASPGTYTMLDFLVITSAAGATIGSLSGGNYYTDTDDIPVFYTRQPFSFDWDGSKITLWKHSGTNTFDWWVFGDVVNNNLYYFFAYNIGNVNDPAKAALYDKDLEDSLLRVVGDLTVEPANASSVPEPSAMILLGLGLIIVAKARKKFKK
jgi:hypothetical protein